MKRIHIFQALRIAASIVCLVVRGLLTTLWVRSYWRFDSLWHVTGSRFPSKVLITAYCSNKGSVSRHHVYRDRGSFARGWRLVSRSNVDVPSEWIGHTIYVQHGLVSSPNNVPVHIPHWSPVALVAAIAAAPWMSWRFSLRTLLLAMAAVAVMLWILTATR
jgi:hypothetical protein